MRLDRALVKREIVETRTKASDLIKEGLVMVNNLPILKPSQMIELNDEIIVAEKTFPWVSRGAKKLAFAIQEFELSPNDKIVFDLGASTGGFTEVLLTYGAKKVYAIDVGHDQLHKKLKSDQRVCNLSGLDVRKINELDLPIPEWIVADLSFISLVKALPIVIRKAIFGTIMICLIKPQFELSPNQIGKNGVVKNKALRENAVSKVADFLTNENWNVINTKASPILGRSGNEEFLLLAKKN